MAFVQKQLVPVQFGGGVDTKVDPKQLQAGKLLTLQNGQFSKQGQINKRYGYDLLNRTIEGGGTITAGIELATFKDELILFDGTSVYSYLEATGNWSNRGTAISLITEDKDVIRTSQAQQLNPDMAYATGVELYAWEDSRGGVRYSVLDTATKAFVVSDQAVAIAGAQQPKCIAYQGLLYLFYVAATNLYYQVVAPLNPTLIQPPIAAVVDGLQGLNFFPYDVTVFSPLTAGGVTLAPLIAVGYLGTTGGTTPTGAIQCLTISALNVIANQRTINKANAITPGNHGAINVLADSISNLWVSWANGTDVRSASIFAYAAGVFVPVQSTVDTADVVVLASIESATPGALELFYEVFNASPYNEQTRYTTVDSNSGGAVGAITTLRSVGLAAKPWKYGGKVFVNTAYASTLQATDFTWYLPTTGTPTIVAKETPGVGGGLQTNGMCPEIANLSAGVYKFANLIAGKLISEANTLFSLLGVNSTRLQHTPTDNFVNATQANTLLIVGGILQGYDGVSVTELGFHIYPENVTAVAGGSGSLSSGIYQYIVEWQWTDNSGQVYRSAPSVPISVTVTAGQAVTLGGPTLRLTSKATSISIVVSRTSANGTNFNRITSTLAPLLNSTSTDSWSFVDTLSDLAAAANELDYTTGGVLANIAPPANSLITTYGNRVFLGGLSDKLLLWYSQTVVDKDNANTVPPQFCAELTVACDPRGGDITALGVLNQTIIIFKAGQIFAMAGNGPDATGNNNDYGDPQLVSNDVGCINANSVVPTPQGLFFQSAGGIYLLDQSLNTTYVGAPVEAFNGMDITSAVLNAQDYQILFCTSTGTALVYDYYFQQWSTWTNHYVNDAVIFQNKVCHIRPDGQVSLQNRSKFTDGPSPVLLSWTLPNLSFAGIQGYQRVFRCFILGTYKGPHTLNVSVAYDFSDSYTQFATVTPSNGVSTWGSNANWGAGASWGQPTTWGEGAQLYEFRVDFKTQKCTSIRLQVSDNQASNYNEGYAIASVVFEMGVLPGGNRLPATRTFGAQ